MAELQRQSFQSQKGPEAGSAGPRPGVQSRDGASLAALAGNQQVLRSLGIRTKLTVSHPDDPDEREADGAASAFASGGAHLQRKLGTSTTASSEEDNVSRQCSSCEEEERVSRTSSGDADEHGSRQYSRDHEDSLISPKCSTGDPERDMPIKPQSP